MARTRTCRSLVVLSCVLLVMTTCVIRGPINVKPLSPSTPVKVESAVKAHLVDGSTIVFPDGLSVVERRIVGKGTQYDLTLKEIAHVTEVPLDKVVALESFEETTNHGLTALASGGAAVVGIMAGSALLVAIFGSCPTVYSESGGEKQLEAELFSYSIAPLFEITDIDRLHAKPDSKGIVQLEVRDEALETHYINQLQLIEARHEADEIVVPDEEGRLLALRQMSTPSAITGRRGEDLRPVLAATDGQVFSTSAATLNAVSKGDLRDSIDLQFDAPRDQKSVALLFRMRNSLLNTVLLYDTMLRDPGAKSLDWMSRDLGQTIPAFKLAAWYSSRMGMNVEVWDDGRYRSVAHIGDAGPIAWKDIAVVVPVPQHEGRMRVRISFPADNWRIDQLQVATGVRRPDTRSIPVAEVVVGEGTRDVAAARSLTAADDDYLRTVPGQLFRIRFDAGAGDAPRTFLLRSRGYYTEWIRSAWVASPNPGGTFVPDDDALLRTMQRWQKEKPDFEARFDATRLPVR